MKLSKEQVRMGRAIRAAVLSGRSVRHDEYIGLVSLDILVGFGARTLRALLDRHAVQVATTSGGDYLICLTQAGREAVIRGTAHYQMCAVPDCPEGGDWENRRGRCEPHFRELVIH